MIERVFHPIGQGAFYSERHQYDETEFNIVYDCGSASFQKYQDGINVIKRAFNADDSIDILFISHFDYDHVSHIGYLKSRVKEIKKVVMPLLQEKQIQELKAIYSALTYSGSANYGDVIQLIESPSDFFGKDVTIIKVEAVEVNFEGELSLENPINIFDENEERLHSTDDGNILKISSASVLASPSNNDWCFIPVNYLFQNRHDELVKKLKAMVLPSVFDFDKFVGDTDYALTLISSKKFRTEIAKVYASVSGGINQNSMLLYSGPRHYHHYYNRLIHGCCRDVAFYLRNRYGDYWDRVGCIYTGDSDLNEVNISQLFQKVWDNVGTLQIPHHGSFNDFNPSVIKPLYCCPMSVGSKNSYGHPSTKVISSILASKALPILVTEELSSLYIEHILGAEELI